MKLSFVFTLLAATASQMVLSIEPATIRAQGKETFENQPVMPFHISRSGRADLVQTVDYFTRDGAASAGIHYIAKAGTITFAPNQTLVVIEVPLLDNGLVDGDKVLELVLTNAVPCANLGHYGYPCVEPPPGGWPPAIFGCSEYGGPIIKDNEHPPTRLDSTFIPREEEGFKMPDGRILQGNKMLLPEGETVEAFVRRNGQIVIKRRDISPQSSWEVVQLNADGTPDPNFVLALDPGSTSLTSWIEQPDGRILIARGFSVLRINSDGSLDQDFAPNFHSPCTSVGHFPPELRLTETGEILFSGFFDRVDGFPTPGIARLLNKSPQPDFRLLTSEISSVDGVAHLRVLRTGPTTFPASVRFATLDRASKAGADYIAQSGTLNFAPLEVTKEIFVPSLKKTGKLSFSVQFSNPAPQGEYETLGPIPVSINLLPELKLSSDSLSRNRPIRVEGTVVGSYYTLENSINLRDWNYSSSLLAIGTALDFDPGPRNRSAQFFRIRTFE